MTDAKFCDIHGTEQNLVKKENTERVTIEKYDERKKKYMAIELDGCIACVQETILERAKARGLDVDKAWKYTLWETDPITGRKSKAQLSPEEYEQYMAAAAANAAAAKAAAGK